MNRMRVRSPHLKIDIRELFNKLKRELDSVAFRTPTAEDSSNNFINFEEEKAQMEMIMHPMQTLPYMKSEIRIEFFFNILTFLILVLYLPSNLYNCFQCETILTYWLLILCLLSTIGIFPDSLVLWKLSNYNVNSDPNLVMGCLYLVMKSNVYSYMSSLTHVKFFMYLCGILRIWLSSTRKCGDSYLLPICYILITSFFIRLFYSFLRFNLNYFSGNNMNEEKKGFSPEEIEKFETSIFLKSEYFNQNSCSICMEEFCENEKVKVMTCKGHHIFHKYCIDKWLLTSKTCPNCNCLMDNFENEKKNI